MSENLGEFFSLIGKAKKEKEDEFRSLVGDLDIDSMFSQVKESIKEDKKKKKKEEKQIKALESWLFTETQLQEKTEEVSKSPIVGVDETEYEKWIEDEWDEEEEVTSEVVEETEEEEVEDTVDHALKILETIKSKEEVRENLEDPEILKIRRELEYLKNLVNAQGGGGEVRLEFLDDVDRDTAKVDGKFLKYQSSTGKWVGADASGGGDSEEASKLVLDARNNNVGYAITIGTPVYQTGYNSGQDRINIEGARASDPSTMPAKGVTITDLDNNTNGQILVYGELEGVDTSAFDVADELFVAPDGGLTNTRPTDPGHLVQKIAVVLKKSASNGAILVYGAGRTNDVPNSISVAGIITASSFDGDLTGNADTATYASSAGIATYATTAGVATEAQGLTGTPDITVRNVSVTGVTTLSGTTTLESSNYLQLKDNTNIIGHNGVNNLFRFTDDLQFRGDTLFFQEYDGTEYVRMSEQFGVQLKHQGSTKLQIESDGITVTGTINDHTIPSGSGTFALTSDVPTNNNELTNGAGYITTSFTNTNQLTNGAGFVTFTNNNQLTNGAGYITTSFTNTNQLTNGAGFITASDDITGTAAGLSGSPDIGVQNIVGVAATFTGDLTVEGTFSYEDITNVDSIGFATFRKGIEVQGAGSTTTTLNVTGVSTLGIVTSSSIFSTGIITATTFSGSLATSDLTGTITNAQLAGSIANNKLVNDSVSLGGVSVDLGASDATPAFDLSDATNYPFASLTGISTDIVGDTSPQLGGNLDLNSNNITGTGDIDFTGSLTVTSTDTGSSAAPELTLYRNSASPAPGDYLGQIMFKGENSNGGQENYAKITGKISDETLGTEDGLIETAIKGDGSFTIVSRQRSDELQLLNGVGLSVDGDSTFTGDIDANGSIDVDGHTELDNLNVSGFSTFVGFATFSDYAFIQDGLNVTGVITASSFVGDGSLLTGIGVGSTDNIITGTAATFNNVVNVGTGITLDATSGIITATNFFGTTQGQVSYITATETLTNKTLRNPTFESGANSPEFLETRYVNATQQDFVQLYTGGSTGSYFTEGEYQKVATITPDGNNQNYTFNIRLTATSASNYQIVNFTGGLRANTLPDLDFTVNFSEEHNGVRFIEPKLWTKETTTAGFILAFEYVHNQNLYGGVNVEATIIPRSSAQRANVVFNTTQDSEQDSIDTGFTERDPTLTLSTVNGIPIFGTEFQIEGSTDNGFETTITSVDATADRTITFPDSTGTVALVGDTVENVTLHNGLITTGISTTTATDQTSIDSFSASTYRSAKYNVQITRGSEYQTTEISVIHDGSDSYGTEYATIKTGTSLATFSTDVSGGNVRLLATPSSATSTVFKLFRTTTEA